MNITAAVSRILPGLVFVAAGLTMAPSGSPVAAIVALAWAAVASCYRSNVMRS